MSGYVVDNVVGLDGLDAEAAFLAKPFSPQVLAGRVREILSQGAVLGTGPTCSEQVDAARAS
jgi:DNA-binding response OmpR family regulator